MTFDLLTYTKGRVESQAKEFEVHLQRIANRLLKQADKRNSITSNGADVFSTDIPSEQAIKAIEAMVDLNLDDHACLQALRDHFISMGISVLLLSVMGPYIIRFELSWTLQSLEEAKKTKGGNIKTFDLLTYTKGRVESQAKMFEAHLPAISNELLRQANERNSITSNGADVFSTVIPSNQAIEAMVDLNLDDHACLQALRDHFISMGISLSVLLPYNIDFELSWSVESLEEAKKTKGGNIMTFDLLTYTKGRVESQAKMFEAHLPAISNKLLKQAGMDDAITSNGEYVFSTVIPSNQAIEAMVDLNLDARACLRALEDHFTGMGISVLLLSVMGPYTARFELSWTLQSLEEAKNLKEETV